MFNTEDFLPVIIPVQPSRRVQVICYVGASEGPQHEFPWTDEGVRDALEAAEAHAAVNTDRDAHVILTGTTKGIYIVRSWERQSEAVRNMPYAERLTSLENSLKTQLIGKVYK